MYISYRQNIYIYIHSHTCLYNVFISLLIFQPHILILWSSKFLSHVKPPWIPAFLNRCRGSRTCTCLAILSSTTPCPLPFVRVERALEFDKNPDPSQRIFTDFSDIIPRAKKNPGIRLPYTMLIWEEHPAAMSAVPLGTATSAVIKRSSGTQALLQCLPSAFPWWSAAKRCSL